jgi:hypothetical protein
MVPLYYLLYQVKNRLDYWIAIVDDDHYYLSKKIANYNSISEKYILVERYVNRENIESEINRKQFNIFKPLYDDLIIKESILKNDLCKLDDNQNLDLFNNILDDTSFNEKIIDNNVEKHLSNEKKDYEKCNIKNRLKILKNKYEKCI